MRSGAIASYNPVDNIMRIHKDLGNSNKIEELQKDGVAPNNPLSTYVHELIHWQEAEEYRQLYGEITKYNYIAYNEWANKRAKKAIDKLQKQGYNANDISVYSSKMNDIGKYDEVYTEYKTKKH